MSAQDIFQDSQSPFQHHQSGIAYESTEESTFIQFHIVPASYTGPFQETEKTSRPSSNGIYADIVKINIYLSATTGNPIFPVNSRYWLSYDGQLITDSLRRGVCHSRSHPSANRNFLIPDDALPLPYTSIEGSNFGGMPMCCPDCATKERVCMIVMLGMASLIFLGVLLGSLSALGAFS